MRSKKHTFMLSILLGLSFFVNSISAAVTSISASLNLRGEYDDNILFENSRKIQDYQFVAIPEVSLHYDTERLNLRAQTEIEIERYIEESDLDTENQLYRLNCDYMVTEIDTVFSDFSFRKDTTLDSELLETGILINREKRDALKAKIGWHHKLNERHDISANFNHETKRFGRSNRIGSDQNTLSIRLDRKLKNSIDTIYVEPEYSLISTDTQEVGIYIARFGWLGHLGEFTQLRLAAGIRYTRLDDKLTDSKKNSWGGLAELELVRKTGISRTGFFYRRDLKSSAEGELIEVDKFFLTMDHKLTERMGTRLRVDLVFAKSDSRIENVDSRFFAFQPELTYALTERHLIVISYRYAWNEDRLKIKNSKTTRNRIWIGLEFNFPQLW